MKWCERAENVCCAVNGYVYWDTEEKLLWIELRDVMFSNRKDSKT